MRSRIQTWLLAALLTSVSVGCGGVHVVPASGVVLMDGEPLKHAGFVRVEPSDGRAATGKINPADGTFSLTTFEDNDGCLPGTHPVSVIVNHTAGSNTISLIADKYTMSETSELQVSIEGPTTDLKIELTGGLKDPSGIRAREIDEGDPALGQ